MKRTILVTTVVLSFLLCFTSLQAETTNIDDLKYPKLNKLEIPEVEQVTLDNGIRLYLIPDKTLPVFRGSVRINCGSYLEPVEKIGLASICGTVLRTGGTSKWTGDEIDEQLESIGGSVETFIGLTSGGANINILSDYTDLGLEILTEILRRPVFDEDKVELSKVQERSRISRRNDQPMPIAIREYRKVIYGEDSPYARHSEYGTINAVERQDLVDFHNRYFKPQNIQMAFWGDFDVDDLVAKIKTQFGDWTREGKPVPPLPEVSYDFEKQVYYVHKGDVNQTNIFIGHIGGLTTDEDYPARIVMNNILGGAFGSRMFNAVRSREGLAYSTFAVYTANISYPGVFYAYVSTKSETTAKAIREVIKVIKEMQTDPPTENEMRMGKDGYLNSFVFNFDSKGEIARRLMAYDFYGLPEDFLFQEKEKVEQVNGEAVITAARDNLRPDALRILVVGKGEDFEIPLDQLGLGNVTEIDITIPSGEEKRELVVNDESLAKGKEILDLGIEAHGGLAAYKSINSISIKTTMTIQAPTGEVAIPQDYILVFPDKTRSEMNFMGMKILNIRDGNTGWKTDMATMQIAPMSEEDLMENDKERLRNTTRIFRSADEPYYQAVYDGTGSVEGTDIDYVAILSKGGESICRMGFESDSHILITKSYWGKSPQGEGTIEEIMSKFSTTNGIKTPHSATYNMNGQKMMQTDVSEYIINGTIPTDAFTKPE